MEVKLKEKGPGEADPNEQPELPLEPAGDAPAQDPVADPGVEAQERNRKLELENAELRGRADALQSVAQPKSSPSNQDAWKATVLGDMNTMQDEDFRTKYKFEKFQATAAILESDFNMKDASSKRQIAELRAEQRLAAKYGNEFFDVRDQIANTLELAAPEVRQDPEKLTKFMETAYLAADKTKKQTEPQTRKGDPMQRRIVSGFDKPVPKADPNKNSTKSETDEIEEAYRPVAKAFGLTSEKERKSLMESDEIPMELGAGLVFRNASKGVEKVS